MELMLKRMSPGKDPVDNLGRAGDSGGDKPIRGLI